MTIVESSSVHLSSFFIQDVRFEGDGEKSTLCTLVIMMKLMDGPLMYAQ